MKRTIFGLVCLLALCVVHETAMAAIISGIGNPNTVVTGGTVVDFESVALGSYNSLTLGNVTINGVDGVWRSADQHAGNFNTTGSRYLDNNTGATTAIDFVFTAPVNAVAFNFGAPDFNWTMTAYDSSNNIIETGMIAPTFASNGGQFYGIQANGIARLRIAGGSGDWILLDRLTFSSTLNASVPEPASLAIWGGLGIAGLVAARRRKKLAV